MMEATTEIILVRHGETVWNAEGRIQGHLDTPLNTVGLTQAAALGARFKAEPIQAIYSSDLDRAYRTAQPIAAHDNRIIQLEPRLRERLLGVLEGLTRDEAMDRQPLAWGTFKSRRPDEPLEGGESLRAFFDRITDFLSEICERHRGERVLLVTHGGVLDAAYRQAVGIPLDEPRNFPVFNASVNILMHDNPTWRIERWGDVDHLHG
jgi:2,3-bisphosphoglycerate-dependent phosphoglycerate mutase